MKRILPLTLLLSLLGCGGSSPDVAGGAEDVNTFVLSGVCVNSSGYLIPNANVQLIPSNYIEGEGDKSTIVTTESNSIGEFTLRGDKEENYSIFIRSRDSVDQYIQFNIDTENSLSRIDTLKPLGLMQFSLPDQYSENAEIVIPGTDVKYAVSDLNIVDSNGILYTEMNLPENIYPEILYSSGDDKQDLTEDEVLEVASRDTTDGRIRPVWGILISLDPVIPGKVTCLEAVDAHTFWVGTETEGVFHIAEDQTEEWTITRYHNIGDITLDSVAAMDASGDSLVIASSDGVVLFANGEFNNLSRNNATVSDFRVNDVTILNDGLIAAAFSTGVGRYKDGTWNHSSSINNAPAGEVYTIDGYDSNRLFAADGYGIFQISPEGSCRYIVLEDRLFQDMVITEKSIHVATDVGVLSMFEDELISASKSQGYDIRAIAGTDSVMWASSNVAEDLFALRTHSSHYYYNNSPLEADYTIGGIGYSEGVAYIATESGHLLNMQYKILD